MINCVNSFHLDTHTEAASIIVNLFNKTIHWICDKMAVWVSIL